MNREQRRLMEREERRQKSQEGSSRREQAAARVSAAPAERTSLWKRLTTFLHDVRLEMKKVSWPTQQQMVAGRQHPTTRVLVDLEVETGRVVRGVPFVVVHASSGQWLVEQVDLQRVMSGY